MPGVGVSYLERLFRTGKAKKRGSLWVVTAAPSLVTKVTSVSESRLKIWEDKTRE